MEVEFANDDLDRHETYSDLTAGMPTGVPEAFRRRMQLLRAAVDERDIAAIRGNRFEKLKGNRAHQHSVRLNRQWRLVLEIIAGDPKNKLLIISLEDYHD